MKMINFKQYPNAHMISKHAYVPDCHSVYSIEEKTHSGYNCVLGSCVLAVLQQEVEIRSDRQHTQPENMLDLDQSVTMVTFLKGRADSPRGWWSTGNPRYLHEAYIKPIDQKFSINPLGRNNSIEQVSHALQKEFSPYMDEEIVCPSKKLKETEAPYSCWIKASASEVIEQIESIDFSKPSSFMYHHSKPVRVKADDKVYLYLNTELGSEHLFGKIGKSEGRPPLARLQDYQPGNPNLLFNHSSWEVSSELPMSDRKKNARQLENVSKKSLTQIAKELGVAHRSEWFQIACDEMANIVEDSAKTLGFSIKKCSA